MMAIVITLLIYRLKSQLALAQWLLEAGANPILKNYWGYTALDIAEHNNDKDAAALLQSYSA